MPKNDFQYGGWNPYTLQRDTWLWDDISLNTPKTSAILEFYFWFRFRPYHRN